MKRRVILASIIALLILGVGGVMFTRLWRQEPESKLQTSQTVKLPEPNLNGQVSVEQALYKRSSVRTYSSEPMTLEQVGQLLWAAQGITRPGGLKSGGYRSAPSAGALYPLEVYVLAGKVEGLASGFYHYLPEAHALECIWNGDKRTELSRAALGQEAIQDAPGILVLSAIFERTTVKYGERGIQYVHAEVGSAAQNIYLQATALNLGTVYIGAFYDEQVSEVLGLSEEEVPLCIMPVGHPDN